MSRRVSISQPLIVTAISLFCLNDSPIRKTTPMRLTAADRCWQEARTPPIYVYSRVNGTLLSRGSTSHDAVDTLYSHGRVAGRHISEAASGKERQDEMEYQPMGSSRATGVTKRRKTRFRSRVEEESRNPGRVAWFGGETGEGCEGVTRDTQRPVGIICTSLGWRWLRLIETCPNACHVSTDRAPVNLQANAGL